jgi:hypothetical protein
MTTISDLPVNVQATGAFVYSNDNRIKDYLSNVQHRDKKSPYCIWTEEYFMPYAGFLPFDKTTVAPNLPDGAIWSGPDLTFDNKAPLIIGKAPESFGRIFLGGTVHVTRSMQFRSSFPIDESNPGNEQQYRLESSDGDQMLVHVQRATNYNLFRYLTSLVNNSDEPLQNLYQKRAQKHEDAEQVVFLSSPRLHANNPSTANYSFELSVDSNYIGEDEYWAVLIEPIDSDGKRSSIGWYGVNISLRFASLLEE